MTAAGIEADQDETPDMRRCGAQEPGRFRSGQPAIPDFALLGQGDFDRVRKDSLFVGMVQGRLEDAEFAPRGRRAGGAGDFATLARLRDDLDRPGFLMPIRSKSARTVRRRSDTWLRAFASSADLAAPEGRLFRREVPVLRPEAALQLDRVAGGQHHHRLEPKRGRLGDM